jgi:hypothetical protein
VSLNKPFLKNNAKFTTCRQDSDVSLWYFMHCSAAKTCTCSCVVRTNTFYLTQCNIAIASFFSGGTPLVQKLKFNLPSVWYIATNLICYVCRPRNTRQGSSATSHTMYKTHKLYGCTLYRLQASINITWMSQSSSHAPKTYDRIYKSPVRTVWATHAITGRRSREWELKTLGNAVHTPWV